MDNQQFLECIFGQSYNWAHVTSFTHDPDNIPLDQQRMAWAGGYYKDTPLSAGNQYYTVSLFSPDDKGHSRRRKAMFSGCYVIGLDDVREKLDVEQVQRLPKPTIVLHSSKYSEQWLYVLDKPCSSITMVDNLHAGLISKGLAPDGKDPGQKGVTRYLRLPDGTNNKAKRVAENNGPFQCYVSVFEPERKCTIEELAMPFGIDLHTPVRGVAVTGAAEVHDHPLLDAPIIIKSELGAGRFDITCPWVEDHTGEVDNGTAIFTNQDGSLGFKCHHGHCETRTGKDLLNYIDDIEPGFSRKYAGWQAIRSFQSLPRKEDTVAPPPPQDATVDSIFSELRVMNYTTPDARDKASVLLRAVDALPHIDRLQYHNDLCDLMHWTKTELNDILRDCRGKWYGNKETTGVSFYNEVLQVTELNQWYDYSRGIFYTKDAFHNAFSHEDTEVSKKAIEGMTEKVHRLDYMPNGPRVWEDNGIKYGNSYSKDGIEGVQGDVSLWYMHFENIGWGGEMREHVLNWMAFTLQFPEKKINHILLLGGREGVGKDFILYPLIKAMGRNSTTVDGDSILGDFNNHLFNTKHLHFNEIELGSHAQAKQANIKLKPLAAAPPETLRIKEKNIKEFSIRNIVNISMTTNSTVPFKTTEMSRRYYALWSDLIVRDSYGQMIPYWRLYWIKLWDWMEDGGYKACIYYLMDRDLSNWNPKVAPPVTEFLRDITEDSKPPALQVLEQLIRVKYGKLTNDVVSTDAVIETIRQASQLKPEWMYCDISVFNPRRLGVFLKQLGCAKKRVQRDGDRKTAWIIRDPLQYVKFTGAELYDMVDNTVRLKAVK